VVSSTGSNVASDNLLKVKYDAEAPDKIVELPEYPASKNVILLGELYASELLAHNTVFPVQNEPDKNPLPGSDVVKSFDN
jgi:hypothetical protein